MNPQYTPISGLWLPLITPFEDDQLDEASLVRLVRHYRSQPIDGLILAATTGEGMTLSQDEVARLVDIAAATNQGGLPLYLGLAGSHTSALVDALDRTVGWPVDGYLITCPYYTRPAQAGLRRHFEALAEATDRPVIIYNIPYRTGVNITNETMLALAGIDNLVGVKDCCTDAAQSFDLISRRPDGFAVLTGEDAQYYGALAQGADGAILASAHVETRRFAEIGERLDQGDRDGALSLWRDLFDIVRLLFAEPSPAAIKHWLWRDGLIASPELRLPMVPVSDALAARLDAAVGPQAQRAAI